ncbi:MAG: hypothetical protein WA004_03885 [Saprospiraceae bacterium]
MDIVVFGKGRRMKGKITLKVGDKNEVEEVERLDWFIQIRLSFGTLISFPKN